MSIRLLQDRADLADPETIVTLVEDQSRASLAAAPPQSGHFLGDQRTAMPVFARLDLATKRGRSDRCRNLGGQITVRA
jgi:hypothetical protein